MRAAGAKTFSSRFFTTSHFPLLSSLFLPLCAFTPLVYYHFTHFPLFQSSFSIDLFLVLPCKILFCVLPYFLLFSLLFPPFSSSSMLQILSPSITYFQFLFILMYSSSFSFSFVLLCKSWSTSTRPSSLASNLPFSHAGHPPAATVFSSLSFLFYDLHLPWFSSLFRYAFNVHMLIPPLYCSVSFFPSQLHSNPASFSFPLASPFLLSLFSCTLILPFHLPILYLHGT